MEEENITLVLIENLLEKFKENSMSFLKWLNSFEYIIDIFKIKDDDKGKYLLYMLNPSVLTKIYKEVSPTNPFDLPYDKLLSMLEEMYAGVKGQAANYRFVARVQLPCEPIEHYALALIKLFSKCTPIIKKIFNIKLRFINGLENKETKALLNHQSKDITFGKAVAIAKRRELAIQKLKINFY